MEHGLITTRETVWKVLKIVDPEGVERRLRHRLKRRQYKVKGPNYIWHIDRYDKLKGFGFCTTVQLTAYLVVGCRSFRRPDTSHFLLEVNATNDYFTRVDDTNIEKAEELCCLQNPLNGCEPDFNALATIIMEENGLNMPTSFEEAELLYLELLHHIRNI